MGANGEEILSQSHQIRIDLVQKFVSGEMSRKSVAEALHLTERSISRVASRVRHLGVVGVFHGNRCREPWNKLEKSLKQTAMELLASRYFDFNICHFQEVLRDQHQIAVSHSTLRRWCRAVGYQKIRRRRAKPRRASRSRMLYEGMLLQMDGSHHRWFNNQESVLILAIDDATSKIAYAEFFDSESTENCLKVLKQIALRKGLPSIIYTDRAGWAGNGKRENFTQFKRACDELGIQLMFAYSPQAKGRVERSFKTLQDRLVPELRLRKIKSLKRANNYLQNEFLPKQWDPKFTITNQPIEVRYRKLPAKLNLDTICCLKYWRKVANDNTFHLWGRVYQVLTQLPGVLHLKEVEVQIRGRKGFTYHQGSLLSAKEVNRNRTNMSSTDNYQQMVERMELQSGIKRPSHKFSPVKRPHGTKSLTN